MRPARRPPPPRQRPLSAACVWPNPYCLPECIVPKMGAKPPGIAVPCDAPSGTPIPPYLRRSICDALPATSYLRRPSMPPRRSGSRPRRGPTVDRHDRPADVRSARRRQVADEVRDFRRVAGALERELLRHLRVDLLPAPAVAELLRRAVLDVVDLALGQYAPGIDAHDAHAVVHALAAERPRERDQRSIAGGAGDVARAMVLPCRADHVDDHARSALAHALVDLSRQVEEAEDLEVPGLAPFLVGQLGEGSLRDRAGIVHQHVHVAAFLPQGDGVLGLAEIHGVDGCPHLVLL